MKLLRWRSEKNKENNHLSFWELFLPLAPITRFIQKSNGEDCGPEQYGISIGWGFRGFAVDLNGDPFFQSTKYDWITDSKSNDKTYALEIKSAKKFFKDHRQG